MKLPQHSEKQAPSKGEGQEAFVDIVELIQSDNIAREIVRLMDEKICIRCFGKDYRPEEQEKLRKADMKLDFYKMRYPDRWDRAMTALAAR